MSRLEKDASLKKKNGLTRTEIKEIEQTKKRAGLKKGDI